MFIAIALIVALIVGSYGSVYMAIDVAHTEYQNWKIDILKLVLFLILVSCSVILGLLTGALLVLWF